MTAKAGVQGRQGAVSAHAEAVSAAVLRRLVRAAHELAAEQLDVYLTWGEPPEAVARKIADVRERAARHGRSVKFGIRLHVIVRETEAAAWAAADELISHLSGTR